MPAGRSRAKPVATTPLARLWARRNQFLLRLCFGSFCSFFCSLCLGGFRLAQNTPGTLCGDAVADYAQPDAGELLLCLATDASLYPYFGNSAIVTVGARLLQVAVASLAGYAFARLRFPARDLIFFTMILLTFVPRAGGLMAQYELMNFLGLRNSLLGLILAFAAGVADSRSLSCVRLFSICPRL